MPTRIELYKINELDKVKHYFQSRTPSAAPLLGYLINTGFYTNDDPTKLVIWCSHLDPFQTNDIVVWIFDHDHRVRIFVSSEPQLDHSEMTAEAIERGYKAGNVNFFKSSQDETLYRQSLDILEHIVLKFMSQNYNNAGQEIFIDMNLLWTSVFHQHFKIQFEAPCYKFNKQATISPKPIQLADHLELDYLREQDIQVVRNSNKIPFESGYIKDCIRLSTVIRRKDTKEPIAWAMTHRDMAVGALHVLPEYRRQGLADVILSDLTRVFIDHYQQRLPGVSLSQIYFTSYVELSNTPSFKLFKKSGYSTVGLGNNWLHVIIE